MHHMTNFQLLQTENTCKVYFETLTQMQARDECWRKKCFKKDFCVCDSGFTCSSKEDIIWYDNLQGLETFYEFLVFVLRLKAKVALGLFCLNSNISCGHGHKTSRILCIETMG